MIKFGRRKGLNYFWSLISNVASIKEYVLIEKQQEASSMFNKRIINRVGLSEPVTVKNWQQDILIYFLIQIRQEETY